MDYGRKEHQGSLSSIHAHDREVNLQPVYKIIMGQAPIMNEIRTNSPAWNRYLELLQGMKVRIEKDRAEVQGRQNDPASWDPAEMARIKNSILCFDAQIDVLQAVTELPQAIMDATDVSKKKIEDFEKKHGNSTDTKAS